MSFSVQGKTAIVTGAAHGIGLAIARHLADKGANIMAADVDEKKLIEEFGDAPEDGSIRTFSGDLRQRLSIANLISATIDAFDQVDILVNASRQVLPTDALDVEDTSVSTLLDQNFMTALQLTQYAAKRMIKQAEDQPEGHHCGHPNPARTDGIFDLGGGSATNDTLHGAGVGPASDQGQCHLIWVGDERLFEGCCR